MGGETPSRGLDGQQRASSTRPKGLDLVFIQDTTGSQEPYIRASTTRLTEVCYALKSSSKLDPGRLRLAVVAFRDIGDDYLTDDFGGFTTNVDTVVSNLVKLTAAGGGDGPEAIAAALDKAFKLSWGGSNTVKVAILITDAPPHGLGESGDDYWDGEPGGWIFSLRQERWRGEALHWYSFFHFQFGHVPNPDPQMVVACEPTLSNSYEFSHDFYLALTQITGGQMIPLTNANILAPVIVGFALEQDAGVSKEEIAKDLASKLKDRDEKVETLRTTPVYKEPPETAENVAVWKAAKSVSQARDQLLGIQAKPRVPDEFSVKPGTTWEKTFIDITLKNLGNAEIQYRYFEDGKQIFGSLKQVQIGPKPTKFTAHEPYTFLMRRGATEKTTSRTWTYETDWDLNEHFN